mgnify:CR=1 FL=1
MDHKSRCRVPTCCQLSRPNTQFQVQRLKIECLSSQSWLVLINKIFTTSMKIIFPTDLVISADIPSDYPIPPIGEELYIRFETFIKEPEDLKKVMDLQGTIESAEYMPSIVQYWQKHPETKPDGF